MKFLCGFILLGLAAGVAAGWASGRAAYVWPEERFGPYSSESKLTPAGLTSYLQQHQLEGLPRVEVVGGADHDFGVMVRDAEGTHDFVIKNTGDAPLELEVAGSTCKCTLGRLADSSLPPGQSTVVHLTWTVKTSASAFSQSARIRTNDPHAGELQLSIHGEVVDTLAADPPSWNIGDQGSGEVIQLQTAIYNRLDHDLRLQEARWLGDLISDLATVDVQQRPVDPQRDGEHTDARQVFDVRVEIRPGLNQGLLRHTLRVGFVSEQQPSVSRSLDIPLSGRIVGAISLLGGSDLQGREGGGYLFDMQHVEAGQGSTARLHVVLRGSHRQDTTLHLGSVTPPDALQAELGSPIERGSMLMYPLELRIPEDAPEIELSGKTKDGFGIVMIESDNPEVSPMRLRVTFTVGTPFDDR